MSLIIVVENESQKMKCLYSRSEAIDWLLSVNPGVPDKELRSMEARALINKYAPGYTIVVNY